MEVTLGCTQTAVAEAFFDGLKVGAASEEPGSVCVAEIVHPYLDSDVCHLESRRPYRLAEPRPSDMASCLAFIVGWWPILASRAACGTIAAVRRRALTTAAAAEGICRQGAVSVSAACGVRLGQAEISGRGRGRRTVIWLGISRVGEEQIGWTKAHRLYVRSELGRDLGPELHASGFVFFG
jgi:hypothetical protein